MTTPLLTLVPLLACLCWIAPLAQDPPRSTAPAATPEALEPGKMDPALLGRLAWICGTWVLQDGKKTTEEHWRPLQGTTILGTSHTFDDTKTTFFEHLRIGFRAGSISYVAMPGGAPPTLFRLAKLEDGLMVFENEKHDHPQRISYERTKDGVTATIGQLDGTRAKSFVFKKKD